MIVAAYAIDFERLLPALSDWLTDAERDAALAYRQLHRQQQFLAGRSLLRWLVATQWHCASGAIAISRQENGAPALSVGGQQWHCSISHIQGAVLVAASPQHVVGVDIETIQPRKRLVAMATAYQDGFFAGIDGSHWPLFYQRWTLAEAVTKAEQGLLLRTLRSPLQDYPTRASHYRVGNLMMCCYSATATVEPIAFRCFPFPV